MIDIDKKVAFLDMDGVIADFTTALLLRLGITRITNKTWPLSIDSLSLEKALKVKSEVIEQVIDDPVFWGEMKPFPWMGELLSLLDNFTIILLTSPYKKVYNNCVAGKMAWIEKHLPEIFVERRYSFCKHKWICAGDNSLLIDDTDDNCNLFWRRGGRAILFPQRWNSNYYLISDRLGYVKKLLS